MLSDIPFIVAHRGASGLAPENTLAAVRRARALGARWIEVDVQLAGDGTPVVIHDHTLERTTNGRGPIASLSAAALAQCDAGSWFSSTFAGEPVPTLAQVLETCGAVGLGLNAELKPAPDMAEQTARAAAAQLASWPGPLLVSSFDFGTLAAFHAAAPQVALAALFKRPPDPPALSALGLPLFSVNVSVRYATATDVQTLRQAGHRVLVYTVNDLATARRVHDWGVSAVFTDHPERLLPAFG